MASSKWILSDSSSLFTIRFSLLTIDSPPPFQNLSNYRVLVSTRIKHAKACAGLLPKQTQCQRSVVEFTSAKCAASKHAKACAGLLPKQTQSYRNEAELTSAKCA